MFQNAPAHDVSSFEPQDVPRFGRRSAEHSAFHQAAGSGRQSPAAAISQAAAMLGGWDGAAAGMSDAYGGASSGGAGAYRTGSAAAIAAAGTAPQKNFLSTSADYSPYSRPSAGSCGQGRITTYQPPAAAAAVDTGGSSSSGWLQAYQQQLQQLQEEQVGVHPYAHDYSYQQQQQQQPVSYGYSQVPKPSSPGPRPLEWNVRASPPPQDPRSRPSQPGSLGASPGSSKQGAASSKASSGTTAATSSSSTRAAPRPSAAAAGNAATGRTTPSRGRPGSQGAPRSSTRVPITPSGYPLAQAPTPDALGLGGKAGSFGDSCFEPGSPSSCFEPSSSSSASSFHPAALQWNVNKPPSPGPGAGRSSASAAVAAGALRAPAAKLPAAKAAADDRAPLKSRAQQRHEQLWANAGSLVRAQDSSSSSSSRHRSATTAAAGEDAGKTTTATSSGGRTKSALGAADPDSSSSSSSQSSGFGYSTGGSSSNRAAAGHQTAAAAEAAAPAAAARPPSQQMSEGLSRLKQLSTARLASRLTTPPDASLGGTLGRTAASAGAAAGDDLYSSWGSSSTAGWGRAAALHTAPAPATTGAYSEGQPSRARPAGSSSSSNQQALWTSPAGFPASGRDRSYQQQQQQVQHFDAAAGSEGGAEGLEGGEYAASGPMLECRSCGRTFCESALERHARICEKVFMQKRKAFNSAAHRLEGTEAARATIKPARAAAAAKGGAASRSQQQQQRPSNGLNDTLKTTLKSSSRGAGGDDKPAAAAAAPAAKKSKWQQQSEQLRAAMRAQKQISEAQARGEDIRTLKIDMGPEPEDDRVPCPHCGRKFAALTAERHIPKCADIIAKPTGLKAGGGKSAFMRTPGSTLRR